MNDLRVNVRTITPADNQRLAGIIRTTLAEFDANKPGTVYYDPVTDRLSEVFSLPNSTYFVACDEQEILGGAGIYPSSGLSPDTCELVKMYLIPKARGKGIGKELMRRCIGFAKDKGYRKVYLETMPELYLAIKLYEKSGFTRLAKPLGNTGHTGCDIWMIRDILQA